VGGRMGSPQGGGGGAGPGAGVGGGNRGGGGSEGAEGGGASGAGQAGFQLGKYMRKLVGGFLRRDDNAPVQASQNQQAAANRGADLMWDWFHHMINHPQHRVSRKSAQLYSRYVTAAQNNLVLMKSMGNQRQAEEEYFILLRDYNIDTDNVTGMEHLSIESYVSSEVNLGVYQGLQQRESAILAHAFLMTSLVQVEAELERSAVLPPEAEEPFAPAPPPPTPAGFTSPVPIHASKSTGRFGVNSLAAAATSPSSSAAGGANAKRSASVPTRLDTLGDKRALVTSTLQSHPSLESHIESCIERVDSVRGLEREFRRNVGDYIKQQASYANEISYGELSTRMSSLTAENTIIEYCMQFHHTSLVLDLDNVAFVASCDPQYESFQELQNLQETLQPLQARVKQQKQAYLQEQQAAAAAAAAAVEDEASRASITSQLGLSGNIAHMNMRADLSTDYSLFGATATATATAGAASSELPQPFPYVQDVALRGLDARQSESFFQLDYDLYVRSTNPFMQLNEVAVKSLSKALDVY
jgi:hypothetical protein